MNKEFIPYEQALALKELGFEYVSTIFAYDEAGELYTRSGIPHDFNIRGLLSAPSFSQAFRWFREKYHIIGEVKFKGGKTTKTAWYDYIIYSEIDWNDENPNEQWKKHEEAEIECLKKLIEIVKNGKC